MTADAIAATAARGHPAQQNTAPQPERLFTLAQIAAAGGFSRSTLYRLRHGGGLRTITVGGVTRVRESDWRAFLEKHAATMPEGAAL
jgi:predicted DNA-binding transcriptional regulator AlpA